MEKNITKIDFINRYNAIWACASLLHVESQELPEVIVRLLHALQTNGILYMSFKRGDFEGERDGRFFLDMSTDRFHTMFSRGIEGEIVDEWYSEDVRSEKSVMWYNVIVRKNTKCV